MEIPLTLQLNYGPGHPYMELRLVKLKDIVGLTSASKSQLFGSDSEEDESSHNVIPKEEGEHVFLPLISTETNKHQRVFLNS